MANIKYCSWATGNDTTGDGSASNPYKTITKASTGLTGGDEVRVAKSPGPTNLTGTLSFTNDSTAVTGTGTAFTTELTAGDFVLGGDGYWWEIVTITSDTSATLYCPYSGTTQSGVASQKLGVTDTGEAAAAATIVQQISSSGIAPANLKISGGWDLSTETQIGQTFFRQIHSTFNNRWGYGLYILSKNNYEITRLHFLRYNYGIFNNSSYNYNISSPICNSNAVCGIYNGSSYNFDISSPICSLNTQYGIFNSSSYNYNISSPTLYSNGVHGIRNTDSIGRILGILKTSGNGTAAIYNNKFNLLIAKASIAESTKVTGFANYYNARISIGDIDGHSEIWTDGGNIVSQDATAGGTDKEWKFSVTSSTRGANYHLDQEIARFLVAANRQVTVKLYFKKSSADAIKAGLFMRGGQIAGVDDDILVECPDDTNRNQVMLQFTPTETGVVSIEVHAWYNGSVIDNVIIDNIDITQG